MKPGTCPERAFTLIELLVVITIIAVLASIAYPVFTGVQERARAVQDMSNLRQIGLATQQYLNDHDGAFFLPTENWMKALQPKYLGTWKIFQSPFDNKRSASESPDTAPVSYGFNVKAVAPAAATSPLTSDRIANPAVFILFAPAQRSTGFTGVAGSPVTVSNASSGPGGTTKGGTHNGGQRINACFADLHTETMAWTTFANDKKTTSDPAGEYRWDPDGP